MPRRTPVREIQSEQNVVDSPMRRSSRIAATTSTPTVAAQGAKVTTRRTSSSSDTSNEPAKLSKKMSLVQESKEAETPKRTSRSSSKSPTALAKEQRHKSTPAVPRTRRVSRSGTDDESAQSTSSDTPRRLTRRSSISEKAPSLEKIEETESTQPKPQKRLTRRRSSASDSTPLEKIVETVEEKPANMETIQENVDEDNEVEKVNKKSTSKVINEMKNKSPIVVMERLKKRSVDNKSEKEKAVKEEEDKKVKAGEQNTLHESDVIVEENTMQFSSDVPKVDEVKTIDDIKVEEIEPVPDKQETTEELSKKSAIDDTDDADIEVSNLTLQITLNPEESEKENLNNSASSDKENTSINTTEKTVSELKDKSNAASANLITNILTVVPNIIKRAISPIITQKCKEENIEEDNKAKESDHNEGLITKARKSVSPAFETVQISDDENNPDINETSEISIDSEKNKLSAKKSAVSEIEKVAPQEAVVKSVTVKSESPLPKENQRKEEICDVNVEKKTAQENKADDEITSEIVESTSTPDEISKDLKSSSSPEQTDEVNVEESPQINRNEKTDKTSLIHKDKQTNDKNNVANEANAASALQEATAVMVNSEEDKAQAEKSITSEGEEVALESVVKSTTNENESPLHKENQRTEDTCNIEEKMPQEKKADISEIEKTISTPDESSKDLPSSLKEQTDEVNVEESPKVNCNEESPKTDTNSLIQEDNQTMQETTAEIDKTDTEVTESNENAKEEIVEENNEDVTLKETKTIKKDILKERQNFNDLVNESESEHETTPQQNDIIVIDSDDEGINAPNLIKKVEPEVNNTHVEECNLKVDDDKSKKSGGVNQKVDEQNNDDLHQERDQKSDTKTPTEEITPTDDPGNLMEANTSTEVIVADNAESSDNKSVRKSDEEFSLEKSSDAINDKNVSDDNLEKQEKNLTRNKSEDIFANEEVADERSPSDPSEIVSNDSEQVKNIDVMKKGKTPSKQQGQEEDLMSSVIDESELADINEFLNEVNTGSSEKSTNKIRRSTLHSEEKTNLIEETENINKDESQKIDDADENEEKQRSFKTSDENSFRETVDNILKNKALNSDSEETDDDKPVNEFIDDMAEEVDEEEEDEVFEDSNEIPCEGESINSTDTESEYEEDTYERDSFIDDEEGSKELLSGIEDFLVDDIKKKKGKKETLKKAEIKSSPKKYTRIVSCDTSSSDSNVEVAQAKEKLGNKKGKDEVKTTPAKSKVQNVCTKVTPVEKGQVKEVPTDTEEIPTICVDTDSEDGVTNIKVDPNNTRASLDGLRRQSIRKSSVNIQENISLQDIDDNDLSERITKVVEWFCNGIMTNNEMSGNISVNVSLDYNDDEQGEDLSSTRNQAAQGKVNKRKSTEASVEEEVSSPKIRKTLEKNETSSKEKRKSNDLSQENITVEVMEDNSTLTPSKQNNIEQSSSKKKKSKESVTFNKESENASPRLSKTTTSKSLKSMNDNFVVNVENKCAKVLTMKRNEFSPGKMNKSGQISENTDGDFNISFVSKDIEVTKSPSSNKKKQSKKALDENDVSLPKKDSKVFSPKKTEPTESLEKDDFTLFDKKKQPKKGHETILTDISEPSTSKLTKQAKQKKKASKAIVVDSTIIEDALKLTEVNRSSTMKQDKQRKKSKEITIGDTAVEEKGTFIETDKEKNVMKKKKRSENIDVIEKVLNEDDLLKTVGTNKKLIKGSQKPTEKLERKQVKGKKRSLSDFTVEESFDAAEKTEKTIPIKQRKVDDVKVAIKKQFEIDFPMNQLDLQNLDYWSNSPAHVTASLSEIPQESQTRSNKKITGTISNKNIVLPSLHMDDSTWQTEVISQEEVNVSKQMKIKKKRDAGTSKVPSYHPRDFKSKMLYCMGRVDRNEKKMTLRNKKLV